MTADWLAYPVLVGAGLVAGALNVIAGGGSFLTLPALIFLGLPATVANGTNRVAILLQNVAAVWGFHRHGVLDVRSVLWAGLPATVGAGLGTWAAVQIGDQAFQRILAWLMVVVSLWTFLSSATGTPPATTSTSRRRAVALGLGFFAVGIYGGFVQAGVGFLLLVVTTLAGLDLVRGNAVKVLSVLTFSVLSLAIFAWQGMIDWTMGLALAAGNVLGGLIGVKLTILKGHRWVQGVVTATVILFAIRLWLTA